MMSNPGNVKELYMEFYLETLRQEKLIKSGDYAGLDISMDRRQKVINKISALKFSEQMTMDSELSGILEKTIRLEKKNKQALQTAMTDLRRRRKAFTDKKNSIMRYSMNG